MNTPTTFPMVTTIISKNPIYSADFTDIVQGPDIPYLNIGIIDNLPTIQNFVDFHPVIFFFFIYNSYFFLISHHLYDYGIVGK